MRGDTAVSRALGKPRLAKEAYDIRHNLQKGARKREM